MLAWLSRQLVLGDGKGSTLRDCPVRGPLAHVCAFVRPCVPKHCCLPISLYGGPSLLKLGQSDTATHMHAWARALNIDQYIGRLRPNY